MEYMLGDLVMKGMYNATGHLGTMWMQIPFNSEGDKPFNITVNNARLVPKITVDAKAKCDSGQNVRITEFTLPFLYDSVESKFDNLDTAFETIFQGIVISKHISYKCNKKFSFLNFGRYYVSIN